MVSIMTNDNADLRTIYDTNKYIQALVEKPNVVNDYFWVGGVVNRVYKSKIGYTYFTIEDGQQSIDCVLSNQYRDKSVYIQKNTFIDVYGAISIFQKQAKIQLNVTDIRLPELSDSQLDKSVLARLEEQNLYPVHRKDLPINPSNISIITSKNSEALRDFKYIYKQQKGGAKLELLDAYVQGELAVEQITRRIRDANHKKDTDIIILTRGGGNKQDLEIYNSYEIAEAICKSKIPIVTGIGHQRDETIADRVADQKTISPTDAAYKLAKLTVKTSKEASPQKTNSISDQTASSIPLQYIVIAGILLTIAVFIVFNLLQP